MTGERSGSGLIVVTGPPGAGKSAVSRVLADRFDPSVLVRGDDLFGFLAKGAVPPWEPAAAHQNEVTTIAAGAAAGRFVTGGYDVVYDGVIGAWLLPTFLAATGLSSLHYVLLLPPLDVCVERVITRADHGFRDGAAARHMHAQFVTAAVDERHVLVPQDDPCAVATQIMRRVADGSVRHPA